MIYSHILRPLLFHTDPEWIHHLSLKLLSHTPAAQLLSPFATPKDRPVKLWNLTFRNPLGLAAGFDKEASAIDAMYHLGFGFTEIGTVTQLAQPGNPKPRVFRCPQQQALINRMGFPNSGADLIAGRLQQSRQKLHLPDYPIGINIGKSKVTPLEEAADDYVYSLEKLHAFGDYFVVNVSSPNTPGLRDLQHVDSLAPILSALQKKNRSLGAKPLLLKIAPDLSENQIAALLTLIAEEKLDGIVATNTTIDHSSVTLKQTGGLSGLPLRGKSTEIIRFIARETNGKLPIIGAGGVFTRDDFQEKLDAGASLVQVYTGFVYQGPFLARQLLG